MSIKPAVTFYIIHHPQSDKAARLSVSLFDWLRLTDSANSLNDAGPPVWFRRATQPKDSKQPKDAKQPASVIPTHQVAPEIEWQYAHLNAVVLLVDEHLVSSVEWCQATEDLMQQYTKYESRVLLLPVALHSSFYRMQAVYNDCNPIRLLDQESEDAAARTLRRLVTEAVARRLRHNQQSKTAPPRLKVFLSHAKADGRAIAESIRDSLSQLGQLEAWYDANELAFGDDWAQQIIDSARSDTAAMISIVTDLYSSRPWCRIEMEAARTPYPVANTNNQIWRLQPAVAVHKPRGTWGRIMQAAAGLPRIGWNDQQPQQATSDIVDRLLLETLLSLTHRHTARHAAKLHKKHAKSQQDTIYITWAPCHYTLASLRKALSKVAPGKPAQIKRIVYPGFDLKDAEKQDLKTVLETFSPDTELISLEESLAQLHSLAGGKHPATAAKNSPAPTKTERRAVPLKITVSGYGSDSELSKHGLGSQHLLELLSRLTIAILKNDMQLFLAGSLAAPDREETNRIIQISETWLPKDTIGRISIGHSETWPVQRHIQWPDTRQMNIENYALNAGICNLIAVDPANLPPEPHLSNLNELERKRYEADAASLVRSRTTEAADVRIIFGGSLGSTRGWMPGSLEETGLSLARRQPLIILGGFGGAASELADYLKAPNAAIPKPLQFSGEWVLRKFGNLPESRIEELRKQHQAVIEQIATYRDKLHQGHHPAINGIPRQILLDCLGITNMRRAVGLVLDALRGL